MGEAASKITPRIFPGTDEAELAVKFKQASKLMDGAKVWSSSYPRTLTCTVGLASVDAIRTTEHKFQAAVSLTYMWPVEVEDVYRSIFSPKDWKPAWTPEHPRVVNGISADAVQMIVDAVTLEKRTEQEYAMQACWRFTFVGEFREVMELDNFPFDSQALNVQFEMPKSSGGVIVRASDTAPTYMPLKASWTFQGSGAGSAAAEDVIECYCSFKRIAFAFVLRVVCVLFMICVLTLGVFTLHCHDDAADRISICLTLLLTAVAYTLVAQSVLPELGYLTFLDMVVLGAISFIAMVTLQVLAIEQFIHDSDVAESVDQWCLVIDILVLVLALGASTATVSCRILPREARKLKDLDSARCNRILSE